MEIYLLNSRAHPECFGLIPSFLEENDPRPAAEQFNERYISGWRHQEKCTMAGNGALLYPGDPPQLPIACLKWRDELILLYPYSYVAIVQKDGSYEICRMD